MAVEMAVAAVMIHAGSSLYCSCSAVADVDVETTAVAADVQCRAEVNPSAFSALYIEASPVARLLIGVDVSGPAALFGAFASDSAFSVYTADLFHKKNCHL